MNIEEWYYPRTEFAETVYDALDKWPVEGVSIFGPRRTGKTSFLKNDLVPILENNGHRVIYTNFWPPKEPPIVSLLDSFDFSLKSRSFFGRIKSLASGLVKSVKLKSPGGMAEVELNLPAASEISLSEGLRKIEWYCERFANDSKPTFLLFDEFQELEKAESAESLVAALRTGIDTRKPRLLAVFAGSSQHRLRNMFSRRDAPFFWYAYPLPLPPLDDNFVDYVIGKARRRSSVEVSRSSAMEVFEQFDRNPLLFKNWIYKRVMMPNMNEREIVNLVLEDVTGKLDFKRQWTMMSTSCRAVAKLVANESIRVYSEVDGLAIEKISEAAALPSAELLEAVNALADQDVLDGWNGDWQIGDPLFKAWIKNLPDTEN